MSQKTYYTIDSLVAMKKEGKVKHYVGRLATGGTVGSVYVQASLDSLVTSLAETCDPTATVRGSVEDDVLFVEG